MLFDTYSISHDFLAQQIAIEHSKGCDSPSAAATTKKAKTEELIRQINSMAVFGIDKEFSAQNPQLIEVTKNMVNTPIEDNGSEQRIRVGSPFGTLNIIQSSHNGATALTAEAGDVQFTMTEKSLPTLQAQLTRTLIELGEFDPLFTLTNLNDAQKIVNAQIEEVDGQPQIEIDSTYGKIAIIQMQAQNQHYLIAVLNGAKFKLDDSYTTLDALKNQAGSNIIKTGNVSPLFEMGDQFLTISSIVNTPIQRDGDNQKIEISTQFGKLTITEPAGERLIGNLNGDEFEFGPNHCSHLTLKELQIHLANRLLENKNIKSLFTSGGFKHAAPDIINAVPIKKNGKPAYIEINSSVGKIRIEETSDHRSFLSAFSSPSTPLKISVDGIEIHNTEFTTIGELQGYLKRTAKFENDLMKLLNTYSQVVASIVKQSVTLDVANRAPTELITVHNTVIREHVRTNHHLESDRLKAILKTSCGNCYEMALLCKVMLDLYLTDSLKKLGYKDVSVQSHVMGTFEQLADHAVAKVTCIFEGNTALYMVDPWSDGQAWNYEVGMKGFRERTPDQYTNPDIFFTPDQDNPKLATTTYQHTARAILNHYKVKEQLDTAIRQANKVSNIPAEKVKKNVTPEAVQQSSLADEKNKSPSITPDASDEIFSPLANPSADYHYRPGTTGTISMKEWKELNFKPGFSSKSPKT